MSTELCTRIAMPGFSAVLTIHSVPTGAGGGSSWRRPGSLSKMKIRQEIRSLAAVLLLSGTTLAQKMPGSASAGSPDTAKKSWTYSITIDGYIVPDEESYIDPQFFADHGWLHLEGRYNYENLRTGSLWVGYNFDAGTNVVVTVTPMIGGVFGRSTGFAPGAEAALTYKKLQLWISSEYVFDTGNHSASFYYGWQELSYSPVKWLHVGAAAQHSKTVNSGLTLEPGAFLGVSHKKWEFTAYEFNAGLSNPAAVLEIGYSF